MSYSGGEDEEGPIRRTLRERLIEEAQLSAHHARSDVDRARLLFDDVPRDLRMALQRANLDYYRALRPLRTEGVVKSWWQEVAPSRYWIEETRVVEEPVVDADLDGPPAAIETTERTEDVPYQGLDVLDELDSMREHYQEVVTDMRGERIEEGERQVVLPAKVLVDISETLDDASKRLGFAPPTRVLEGSTNPV